MSVCLLVGCTAAPHMKRHLAQPRHPSLLCRRAAHHQPGTRTRSFLAELLLAAMSRLAQRVVSAHSHSARPQHAQAEDLNCATALTIPLTSATSMCCSTRIRHMRLFDTAGGSRRVCSQLLLACSTAITPPHGQPPTRPHPPASAGIDLHCPDIALRPLAQHVASTRPGRCPPLLLRPLPPPTACWTSTWLTSERA